MTDQKIYGRRKCLSKLKVFKLHVIILLDVLLATNIIPFLYMNEQDSSVQQIFATSLYLFNSFFCIHTISSYQKIPLCKVIHWRASKASGKYRGSHPTASVKNPIFNLVMLRQRKRTQKNSFFQNGFLQLRRAPFGLLICHPLSSHQILAYGSHVNFCKGNYTEGRDGMDMKERAQLTTC